MFTIFIWECVKKGNQKVQNRVRAFSSGGYCKSRFSFIAKATNLRTRRGWGEIYRRTLSVAFLQQVEKHFPILLEVEGKKHIFPPNFSRPTIIFFSCHHPSQQTSTHGESREACILVHKGWKILLNQIKWDIRLFYTSFFICQLFSRYVVFSRFSDPISFHFLILFQGFTSIMKSSRNHLPHK